MEYYLKNKEKKGTAAYYCLLVYLVSLPLYMLGQFGGLSIPRIVAIVILPPLLLSMFTRPLRLTRSLLLWLLYVIYLFISCIWSGNQTASFSSATGMLFVFVLSFLLAQYKTLTKKQVESIKTLALIISIGSIMITLFSSEFVEYGQRVQIILFGKAGIDENETCSYFFLGVAVAIERIFKQNGKWYKRIFYTLIPALALYSSLLLGSRGGMIACLAVIVFSIAGQLRRSWKYIVILIIFAAVFALLFETIILPELPENLLKRFTVESMSSSARFEIWTDYLNNLFMNPLRLLFGWGAMGSSGISLTNVLHNMIFQVLVDSGIIGFTIYISFLWSVFKNALRGGNFITAAFFGCQVALLSLSTYANMKMIWAIYLLCILFGSGVIKNEPECVDITDNKTRLNNYHVKGAVK